MISLREMSLIQLEEYCDRLRVANHACGRLDHEEWLATEEWKRRQKEKSR